MLLNLNLVLYYECVHGICVCFLFSLSGSSCRCIFLNHDILNRFLWAFIDNVIYCNDRAVFSQMDHFKLMYMCTSIRRSFTWFIYRLYFKGLSSNAYASTSEDLSRQRDGTILCGELVSDKIIHLRKEKKKRGGGEGRWASIPILIAGH